METDPGGTMLSAARRAPGYDNRQLVLNVMHWLTRLPGLGGSP
jgi:hypothetical protein